MDIFDVTRGTNNITLTALSTGTAVVTAKVIYGESHEATADCTVTVKEAPKSDEPKGILGDVDNDGVLTSADALEILRASTGAKNLTPEQTKLADVDGDGVITSNDALMVLGYSVGLFN